MKKVVKILRKEAGAIFVVGGGLFFLGAIFGWPGIMIVGLILMVGMLGIGAGTKKGTKDGGGKGDGSDGPFGPGIGGFGGYD